MSSRDFDVHRVLEIIRQYEAVTVAFLRRHGHSHEIAKAPALLADPHARFHEELQALRRIVIVEAKAAGLSAADVHAMFLGNRKPRRTPAPPSPRWTWPMLRDYLAAETRARIQTDARHLRTARKTGGSIRGAAIRRKAAANDAQIRRLYERWRDSDELQDQYLSAAAYIEKKTALARRTIERRLGVILRQ